MVVVSVQLVFWDAPEARHERPTSQRSRGAPRLCAPLGHVAREGRLTANRVQSLEKPIQWQ